LHRKINGLGCYRVAETDTMIRCVRIWTGDDGNSLFEEGTIDLPKGARGDILSDNSAASSISFRETRSGGAFAPHDAPTRQFVITLAGTLEFKTASQETFIIHPGDILLAEDTKGSGHSWRLVDDNPWRRAYVILAPDVAVPFRKTDR
jgi:quercetin dioxygenase-like cupin family protein